MISTFYRCCFVVAFFSTSLTAQSTGINCAYAKTKIDRMICSDEELLALDGDLNVVFTAVQQESAGIDGETGARIDPIGKEEKAWIFNIRNKCNDVACLKTAYRIRIGQIKVIWAAYL